MNITELKGAVDQALEAGLHPDTSVVIARDGWYYHLCPEVEHPLNSECDMWFTLSARPESEGSEEWLAADARFSPGHVPVPDPVLHAEFEEDCAARVFFGHYHEWLRERYEGLAGAFRDDPPRDRAGLADTYRGLAALLAELEKEDPE